MSSIFRRAAIALIFGGFAVSCTSRPPTAAVSTVRVNFHYTVSPLGKAPFTSEMLWNGSTLSLDSASASGMQVAGVIPGVRVGPNTFAIRIVSQPASPAAYSIIGVVTATGADGATQTFPLAIAAQSLATGQSVTVDIAIAP